MDVKAEFIVQYGCKFFKLLSAIFTVLSQILTELCVTPEVDLLKTTSLETLNCRGLFMHRCVGCATDLSYCCVVVAELQCYLRTYKGGGWGWSDATVCVEDKEERTQDTTMWGSCTGGGG